MNEKDALFLVKELAWVLVTAICWLYAIRGHSSFPRFDPWFWGIAFCLSSLMVVAAIFKLRAV